MLGTSTRIWPDNYGADMSRTAERLVPPLPLPVLTTRRGAAFRARDSSLTAAARRSNCSAAKKQPRARMALPGLGSRFEGMKRHTTAYAPSWQASGNSPAPYWHFKDFRGPVVAARNK